MCSTCNRRRLAVKPTLRIAVRFVSPLLMGSRTSGSEADQQHRAAVRPRVVEVRDGHQVRNKAAHIAVVVDLDGIKHVLGIWVQASEGAKLLAGVCAELRNRGVRDVLIVCCDGLTGFTEAVDATSSRQRSRGSRASGLPQTCPRRRLPDLQRRLGRAPAPIFGLICALRESDFDGLMFAPGRRNSRARPKPRTSRAFSHLA